MNPDVRSRVITSPTSGGSSLWPGRIGPAWTSNNIEGSFSLEFVMPTLLEGSIWRLRFELLLLPLSLPQYKRSLAGLLGDQGSTHPKGRSSK